LPRYARCGSQDGYVHGAASSPGRVGPVAVAGNGTTAPTAPANRKTHGRKGRCAASRARFAASAVPSPDPADPSRAVLPSPRLLKPVPRVSGNPTALCKMRFTGRLRICRVVVGGGGEPAG